MKFTEKFNFESEANTEEETAKIKIVKLQNKNCQSVWNQSLSERH